MSIRPSIELEPAFRGEQARRRGLREGVGDRPPRLQGACERWRRVGGVGAKPPKIFLNGGDSGRA